MQLATRKMAAKAALLAAVVLTATSASASTGGFDASLGVLETMVEMMTGKLGRLAGIAAIAFAAYQYLFGEARGINKLMVTALAIGGIVGAVNIVDGFGMTSGALF